VAGVIQTYFKKHKLCGCNYIYRIYQKSSQESVQVIIFSYTEKNLNTSNLQGVAQTNETVEIVSTGRIEVTVIEGANTMHTCKTTATPPVITAIVSKMCDIHVQQ